LGAETDDVWICTIPTPIARKKRDSHFVELNFLRRRATEKAAVVKIFIWYVTWKEATGRLLMATN